MKTKFIKEIKGRFKFIENDFFLATTLLDYKFKNFEFVKNEEER